MQEVSFTLQTITPLFLAGADQTTAEVRTPAFRGGMRYWYRAMVGGLVGTGIEGLKKVREAEDSIFGTTDKGSSVNIRVLEAPTKTFNLRREGTGKDYLLWSVLRSRRQCFLPGTRFQIKLSVKDHQEQRTLQQAVGAFWLLTHLGGLGSRSRRCAGSLLVTHIEGNAFELPFQAPTSVSQLQEQLEQGIIQTRGFYTNQSAAAWPEPNFDVLAPQDSRIWMLLDGEHPWQSVNQALSDIGERLQTYRQTQSIQKRKIFGIPVMVLNNDGKAYPLSIKGAGSNVKRIASPLHLHLSEIQTNQGKRYVGLATLFKTKWKDMSKTDYQLYSVIEDWIAQKFPNALEVSV